MQFSSLHMKIEILSGMRWSQMILHDIKGLAVGESFMKADDSANPPTAEGVQI